MARRTVVLIEKDPKAGKLLNAMLTLGGYATREAAAAEEGTRLAKALSPACIIVASELSDGDGFAAARALKQDPGLSSIPLILLIDPADADGPRRAAEAGSDAWITTPVASSSFLATMGRLVKGPAPAATPSRGRILVVDDEPMVVSILSRRLRDAGYDVREAFGGAEAVQKAGEEAPDLILLDIRMPEVDGFEVMRRLRRDLRTAQIPVILVSALNDARDRAAGLDAGADEFLSKPVDHAELLVRISSILRLAQYREQLRHRGLSSDRVATPEDEGVDAAAEGRILVSSANGGLADVGTLLARRGYRVEAAGQDLDAARWEVRGDVGLVLIDAEDRMEQTAEACRAMRAEEGPRVVPLVIVMPQGDPEAKVRFLTLGADDVLVRPVNGEELMARVERLLRRKKELDSLRARYLSALSAATSDPLTGLYNHGHFKRFLALEVRRSQRQSHPTSLVLLDIDDFKSKNDTFGHLGGDRILGEVASRIRESVREIDLPARYGGEEFAVVLPYTGRDGAAVVAERIRSAIAGAEFIPDAALPRVTVTVSVGVAVCPDQGATPDELVGITDSMLYKAKKEGKNRVVVAGA